MSYLMAIWWLFKGSWCRINWENLSRCGCNGIRIGRIYINRILSCWNRGYGVALGIKRWFDGLFDGCLKEESVWGLRFWWVKEKAWFGVVRKKKGRRFYCVQGLYEQYREQSHKREKKKKKKKKRKKRNGGRNTQTPTRFYAQNSQ